MKNSPILLAIGFVSVCGLMSADAAVSSAGLVGYYTFDSDSTDDTSASRSGSASNNSGSWTGSATYKAGAFGRAAEIGDGAGSNYLSVSGGEYNFGSSTSFTVIYWVNTEANVTGDPSIIAGGGKNWAGAGASRGWVSAMSGDDVKANIGDGSNRGDAAFRDLDNDVYWAGQGQPGDHWNFVALVVDRAGQTLTNYVADEWVTATSTIWSSGVNGQDFGQDTSDPTVDSDISNVGDVTNGNTTIVMGQDGDGAGYSLPASGIDDVSIWTRSLSREELWESCAEGRLNNSALGAVAVPEPSSLALFGLGGLALLSRRRK